MLPIVFSTTMNNINWSIGLEVTLSVLGFTDIETPTIGTMIYWANQHTAMVAGIWWWIAFPVALVVMTFIGLFLLAVSMNEYIDPRSRLSRMGAHEPMPADGSLIRRRRPCAPTIEMRLLRHRARGARGRRHHAVRSSRNEIYGLAGESSCGKTTLIKTIAGAIRPPLRWSAAPSRFNFRDRRSHLRARAERRSPTIRWKHLSYIMQGSMNVLNPVRRVRTRSSTSPSATWACRSRQFLDAVDGASASACTSSRRCSTPIRTSCRAACASASTIALATVCQPEFIIADEPTTALDVVVQKDVLAHDPRGAARDRLVDDLRHPRHGRARQHRRPARHHVRRAAGRGRRRPRRSSDEPQHPYTQHLIASLPRIGDMAPKNGALRGAPPNLAEPPTRLPLPSALSARHGHLPRGAPGADDARPRPPRRLLRGEPARAGRRRENGAETSRTGEASAVSGDLLAVEHVTRIYSVGGLLARDAFRAVDDVSFALDAERPEIFAIIGESGSGKTTLARMILNMVPPSAGSDPLSRHGPVDDPRPARRGSISCAQVQPIFQNPFEAFNPLKRVDRYLFATARRFAGARGAPTRERGCRRGAAARSACRSPRCAAASRTSCRAASCSASAIARALISAPALIVADEPVSMVDASLRMSIVNLFKTLRDELGVSIVYITHDLATAYYISDRVIIMQKGRVVEAGPAREVLSQPAHPYTILLKESVLSPDDAGTGRLTAADKALEDEARLADPATAGETVRTATRRTGRQRRFRRSGTGSAMTSRTTPICPTADGCLPILPACIEVRSMCACTICSLPATARRR